MAWDIAMAAACAASVAVAAISVRGIPLLTAAAGLAVLAAGYLALGRRSLGSNAPTAFDVPFSLVAALGLFLESWADDLLANWKLLVFCWVWLACKGLAKGWAVMLAASAGLFAGYFLGGHAPTPGAAALYCVSAVATSLLVGSIFTIYVLPLASWPVGPGSQAGDKASRASGHSGLGLAAAVPASSEAPSHGVADAASANAVGAIAADAVVAQQVSNADGDGAEPEPGADGDDGAAAEAVPEQVDSHPSDAGAADRTVRWMFGWTLANPPWADLRLWDSLLAFMVVLGIVMTVGWTPPDKRWAATVAMALIVGSYLAVGRGMLSRRAGRLWEIPFSVIILVGLGLASWAYPQFANAIILVCPWLWLVAKNVVRGVVTNVAAFAIVAVTRTLAVPEPFYLAAFYCSGRLLVSLLVGLTLLSLGCQSWPRKAPAGQSVVLAPADTEASEPVSSVGVTGSSDGASAGETPAVESPAGVAASWRGGQALLQDRRPWADLRLWDGATGFALVLGIAVTVCWTDPDKRWASILGMTLMIAAYVAFGRGMVSGRTDRRFELPFDVLTLVGLALASWSYRQFDNAIILICPWLWLAAKNALRGSIANVLAFVLICAARALTVDSLLGAAFYCSGRFVVSVLIGYFLLTVRDDPGPPEGAGTEVASAPDKVPLRLLDTPLSPRECDVLVLMAEGLTNQEISERLILSPHTVKTHVEHILAKMEVANRTAAVIKGREVGWL
ncbi:MAG: response regulator transcription factor [Propionibacteriaceae bacterium]|nr:response regulator transcription factor [Propionibacteriaceae bacterium]